MAFQCMSPSNIKLKVKTKQEKDFYNQKVKEYSKYKFEHPADLDTLDQLLYLMLMNFRYMQDSSRIYGKEQDKEDYAQRVKSNSIEIRALMDSLQLSSKQRNAGEEERSVKNYIELLLKRAKAFNVHRNIQMDKAREIIAKMQTMLRMKNSCDKEEKEYLGLNDKQVLNEFDKLINQYKKIDEKFKEEQRTWWLTEDEGKVAPNKITFFDENNTITDVEDTE